MSPEEFVTNIKSGIVDENISIYKNLFNTTQTKSTSDLYWKKALEFYQTLNDSQKSVFFEILKQIITDTTSNILGVLDGSSYLDQNQPDFIITSTSSSLKLNGNLQNLFLEITNTE